MLVINAMAFCHFADAAWHPLPNLQDGTLAVHQLNADGNSIETLTVTSFDHGIADLALLPDGRTVVVAVKDTPFLHLYDAHELQVTLLTA